MARIHLHEPRAVALREQLVRRYLILGSVNALCEALNEALEAEGLSGTIYPNRIHTLFLEDPTRSVNAATFSIVEAAVAAVDGNGADEALPGIESRVREAWALHATADSEARIEAVAESLSMPVPVVRYVLQHAGLIDSAATSPTTKGSGGTRPSTPDWSFQDDAVRKCVHAIRSSPSAKTGLVVPTGGSKTRIALRTGLEMLAGVDSADRKVVWITHRKNLRTQAHAELQKMLGTGVPGLPDHAAALLAERVEFVMLSKLEHLLQTTQPLLLIVDEAHHAAAASYAPIFDTDFPLRALFLTATPNRTDGLPLGIDSIAYTMTYRELASRGVIHIPEFRDFPVDNFSWTEADIENLVDYVIDGASNEFSKTLVLAPRVDRVEEFHAALISRIAEMKDHPLTADDIGFAHGGRNSLGCDNEEFLAVFRAKPRAIIVSAQLLLEGFDDPSINTVVITYPSQSLVQLMQAAGRCVRYSPEKRAAFVVQARNDKLAYHFDHRWLYQEISDELRPALRDIAYSSSDELVASVREVMQRHNVSDEIREPILRRLAGVSPGDTCRLLLSGLPYFGDTERFEDASGWTAILQTAENDEQFRWIFNDFSSRTTPPSDPTDLLRQYGARFDFGQSFKPDAPWIRYTNLLTAMYRAREEVFGDGHRVADGANRPFQSHGHTTWLRYVTFRFEPPDAPELREFLEDCHNAEAILQRFMASPEGFGAAVKLPIPLGENEAYLLPAKSTNDFFSLLDTLTSAVSEVAPGERTARLAAVRSMCAFPAGIPVAVIDNIGFLLGDAGLQRIHDCRTTKESEGEMQ